MEHVAVGEHHAVEVPGEDALQALLRRVAIPDPEPLERQPELPGEEFEKQVEYLIEEGEVGADDSASKEEGVEQT